VIAHKPAHAAETGLSVPQSLAVVEYRPRQAVCNVGVPEMFDVLDPDADTAVADGLIPSIIDHM
jgi:hypothetical protein